MRISGPDPESSAERDFTELATRPLADRPDEREVAQLELLGQLSRTDPAKRGGMAEKAISRLAKVEPDPKGKLMGQIAAAWLLLAVVVALQAFAFMREGKPVPVEPRKFPQRVTERREFTNAGDLEDYLIKEGKMPPDFHEIWTRIDPDNGAWPWMEALWLSEEGWNQATGKRKMTGGAGWEDEDFARVWHLVEQAAAAPRFEWYFPERRVARQTAAGAGRSVLAIACQVYHNMAAEDSIRWSLGAEELLSERTTRLVMAGDKQGLNRTIQLWQTLFVRIGLELENNEDRRVLKDLMWRPGEFLNAMHTLSPDETIENLSRQFAPFGAAPEVPPLLPYGCQWVPQQSFWDWPNFLENYSPTPPEAERGFLASTLMIAKQPAADYEPGRLAEYALTERVMALAAAVLLLAMMIPLWLKARLRERSVRCLAEGLAPLLDKRDWLWLLVLGVAAPLAWYWGITRLTHLGYRSIGGTGFLILVQGITTFLLILTMIELSIRWRVSVRTAVIALSTRRLWPACCLALLLAAAIPLAGAFKESLDHAYKAKFLFVIIAAGSVLLLLLCTGIAKLLPIGRTLYSALLERTALPVMTAAVVLLSGTHALLLAQERSLLERDPLTGWDAARGTTRYEGRLLERVNAHCRELWEQGSLDQQELYLPRD